MRGGLGDGGEVAKVAAGTLVRAKAKEGKGW